MITIREKVLSIPLIQGGMGVGISLGNLAGSVAKCGGMGVISVADIGYREDDFWKNADEANDRALKEEIRKAKEIAGGNGMVAINSMVAGMQYARLVKTAIASGIDCIISGAGLPLELPAIAKDSGVAIAPIVSSAKAAGTICKLWEKRHGVLPDFVVVEGPKAGGHLGFDKNDLLANTAQTLEELVVGVIDALKPYVEKAARKIPVFAAGGIASAEDVVKFIDLGADGVQIATRFIATDECDASTAYKQRFVEATEEDIQIVKSPVGMPGRALRTPLIEKLEAGKKIKITKCIKCLIPCDVNTTEYCITDALIQAAKGDYENGLFFCGSEAWKIDKIVPVKEVIDELMSKWRER